MTTVRLELEADDQRLVVQLELESAQDAAGQALLAGPTVARLTSAAMDAAGLILCPDLGG